ncbi:MAG: SulP family inorganic anion transporter [Bacteroidia bacterium]|nr:SulP family inorganic anion transporter [Bacteroidia bacterium]
MKNLKYDLPSSLVVYLVALPLCLGVALASGAPLLSGIISGIIGGVIVGFFSGSQTSVSGPAAGLATIVLASITELGGFEVFSVALLLAGVLQMAGGFFKGGMVANYIPSNVIKGLLAAIGILLILKQIPHALGYDIDHEDAFSFIQSNHENTFSHLFGSFSHYNIGSIAISFISVLLLFLWDKTALKKLKLFPASLAVVALSIGLNEIFRRYMPTLYIEGQHLVTIPSTGISELFKIKLPALSAFGNYNVWVVAFTLAIVASLETLLNLEAVDNIDPHKRESPPNKELIAQGLGNMLAGFFGGLPVTSVIVRSSVNIDAGAKTKLSSILHGLFLLISILTITSVLNLIPLAALAAILIMTGYKLAKGKLFKEMFQKGWNQFIPFMATILGILFTDLLIGVLIGLGVSIFYLLRSNFRNPFTIEKEVVYSDETIRIELPNQVSFLNKATIKSTLWSIPNNSKVILDASKTDYIDNDVLEIIKDFKEVIVPERNIKLNKIGLKKEYDLTEHIQFINVLDKKTQQQLTPDKILNLLKAGNNRFINGKWSKKEFKHQVDATSSGQYPMAVILSCIDSRITPEMVFDSNLGDLISIRVAGNIINNEIIGSMELSHKEIGTKLIVVKGHANCGAINAAIHGINEGYIALITQKIKPSIDKAIQLQNTKHSQNNLLEEACRLNIQNSLYEILKTSQYITEQIKEGKLGIVSAYYDTTTGNVSFGDLIASKEKLEEISINRK